MELRRPYRGKAKTTPTPATPATHASSPNPTWLRLATAVPEDRCPSCTRQSDSDVVQLSADPSPPDELEQPRDPIAEKQEEQEDEQPDAVVQARFSTPASPAKHRVSSSLPARVSAALSSGDQLAPRVRAPFERFFGHDFSRVRVHADSRSGAVAKQLGAHAFTMGNEVGFGSGRYAPGTSAGDRLLAHELTHVVQQTHGVGSELRGAGIGSPGDPYEREADQNAERFVSGAAAARMTARSSSSSDTALQLYSSSAAVSYARTWANGTNPAFPRFSNDCTNFVSQALLAGGWTMLHDLTTSSYIGPGLEIARCSERTADWVWWYDNWYCAWPDVRASYTWAGAQNLANFMSYSGRGTSVGAVRDLGVGDVLQMDFGSGTIHHSMIVTDKRGGNLYLSYHTSDHLDEPFWGTGGILDRNPHAKYHAWKL